MTGWDVALLAVVGYMAVMSLARMMLRKRDAMLTEFREAFQREKERKKKAQKRAARQSRAA